MDRFDFCLGIDYLGISDLPPMRGDGESSGGLALLLASRVRGGPRTQTLPLPGPMIIVVIYGFLWLF